MKQATISQELNVNQEKHTDPLKNPIGRAEALASIDQALKGRKGTYIPYDDELQCFVKPPEWSDARWEIFCEG
jgi:hypothetical protein